MIIDVEGFECQHDKDYQDLQRWLKKNIRDKTNSEVTKVNIFNRMHNIFDENGKRRIIITLIAENGIESPLVNELFNVFNSDEFIKVKLRANLLKKHWN